MKMPEGKPETNSARLDGCYYALISAKYFLNVGFTFWAGW